MHFLSADQLFYLLDEELQVSLHTSNFSGRWPTLLFTLHCENCGFSAAQLTFLRLKLISHLYIEKYNKEKSVLYPSIQFKHCSLTSIIIDLTFLFVPLHLHQ